MSPCRSLAAALAAVAIFSTGASAAPWGLARGDFYTELRGSAFSSNSYYRNADEARVSLGAMLEERAVTSHNEFGWRKNTTLIIEVPFLMRSVTPYGAPGQSSSTGLGDIGVGVRYALHSGGLPVALELGWSAPLGTNRRLFPGTSGAGGLDGANLLPRSSQPFSDTTTFFSQGLQSLSASLEVGGNVGKSAYWSLGGGMKTFFFTPDSRFFKSIVETVLPFSGGLGLNIDGGNPDRTADFATGTAEVGYWIGPRFLASGTFRGEWSTYQGGAYDRIDGPVSSGSDPEMIVRRMLVGPRFTYRVDDRMDAFAGSWHTPSGRNVLHYDQYYVGIAWKHTGLDRLAGALGGTKSR